MSQSPTRVCTQCGVHNPLSQPFCSNCGTRQDVSTPNIPGALPGNDISSGQSNPYVEQSSPYQGQGTPSTQYGGGYQQGYQSPQQSQQQGYQQQYQQTPSYAQPQANNGNAATGIVAVLLGMFLLREVRSRAIGCMVTFIIVFAIIGCALLSYH